MHGQTTLKIEFKIFTKYSCLLRVLSWKPLCSQLLNEW